MSFSQTDLIREALRELNALDATSAVSAEDSAAVQVLIGPVASDLAARRVVTIADTNAIADAIFFDFVVVLSERAAPRFGRATNADVLSAAESRLASNARLDRSQSSALARAVLERLDAVSGGAFSIDSTAVSAAIQSVLDDLSGRRIIAIANEQAITSAQTPNLVTLVAARIQPKAVEPQAVEIAEDKLRELSRLDPTITSSLVKAVLGRLEALDAGSDAVDAAAVAAAVPGVLADLGSRRIASIANEASISAGQFPHVVSLVVGRVQPKAVDPALLIEAETKLREATRLDRSQGTPLSQEVLDLLQSIGGLTDAIDATAVAARIPQVLEDLCKRRIITYTAESGVYPSDGPYVARLVAAALNPAAIPADLVADAYARLAEHTRRDRIGITGVARMVLDQLDAVGANSEAVDATTVSAQVQPTLDDLAARRIASYANEGAIPSKALVHVSTLVAARCAPGAFGPEAVAAAETRLREVSRLDRTAGTALSRAALDRLQVLDAANDALDVTAVAGQISPLLADLAARRIVTLADENAVTPQYWPHVLTLLVSRCAPEAIPLPLVAEAENALREIARLDRTKATPLVRSVLAQLEIWGMGSGAVDAQAVADQVQPLLDDLAARNVIYVADEDSVDDKPGVQAALTRFIAAWLAPKPMGDVIQQAEASLRTIARISIGAERRLRVDPALMPRRRLGTLQLR